MKKLIILFLSVALFSSCGKLDITPDDNDDTSSSSTKKVSGNMKATLDGKSWEAKSLAFGGLFAQTDVVGKIDDSNLISFQFADTNLEVGKTYEFDSKNFEANLNSTLLVKIADKTFFSKSGTFKITKYKKNQVIEGEISAELSNFIDPSIELKNCKFSMEYK